MWHVGKRICIKPALCFYRKGASKKFYDVITARSKIRILLELNKSSIIRLTFETLYNMSPTGFSSGTLENKLIYSIVSDCFPTISSPRKILFFRFRNETINPAKSFTNHCTTRIR